MRKPIETTTNEQRIIFNQLIDEGYSVGEIAKMYALNNCTVKSSLARKIYKQEDIDKLIEMYLNNVNGTEIAKYFGVSYSLVYKILQENGIDKRNGGHRFYQLNEHYFDEIDTPNQAYILGLFYADGSNSKKKSTISISLQEEDRDILEKIRNEIQSEKELEFLDYSNKHDGGYNYKNQYRLLLFSAHMCRELESKGMVPNKSLVLKFPEWLREDLIPHFLRGYIDGDGHIAQYGSRVEFTSTNDFCQYVKKYIEERFKVHVMVKDASCHNGVTSVLGIYTTSGVKAFLDCIYENADLYLKRKYLVYYNRYVLGDINNAQTA